VSREAHITLRGHGSSPNPPYKIEKAEEGKKELKEEEE
jgi:hypothetical protein